MIMLFCCSVSKIPLGTSVCDGLMVRITLATLVIPSPDPVIISVNDPVGELPGMAIVRVEEYAGFDNGMLKTLLTPVGSPVTLKETCELKPSKPTTLTENEAVWP